MGFKNSEVAWLQYEQIQDCGGPVIAQPLVSLESIRCRSFGSMVPTWHHSPVSTLWRFTFQSAELWNFSCPFLRIKILDPTWECGFKAFQWGQGQPNLTQMTLIPQKSQDDGEVIHQCDNHLSVAEVELNSVFLTRVQNIDKSCHVLLHQAPCLHSDFTCTGTHPYYCLHQIHSRPSSFYLLMLKKKKGV